MSTSELIRPEEERTLAVLKHIAGTIKPSSRWYAIFQRYIAGIEDKVRGVGGTPGQIGPSTAGEQPRPKDDSEEQKRRCCRLFWIVVVLTALFFVTAAVAALTGNPWPFALIAIALAVVFVVFAITCLCRKDGCC